MELRDARELLDLQSGVVSRRQHLQHGATDADIRRWVRRRELARVHTGVYVNHTGPLTWHSRGWAAVLFHWPAALAHDSVINRAGDVVHVAIDESRTATPLPRVRVHRLVGLEERVQWNLGPPRVRLEDALLSRCSEAPTRRRTGAGLGRMSSRLATPGRLAGELSRRPRVTHRAWLFDVLQWTASSTAT